MEARDSAKNAASQSARAALLVHTFTGPRGILPNIIERERSEAIRNKCGVHSYDCCSTRRCTLNTFDDMFIISRALINVLNFKAGIVIMLW